MTFYAPLTDDTDGLIFLSLVRKLSGVEARTTRTGEKSIFHLGEEEGVAGDGLAGGGAGAALGEGGDPGLVALAAAYLKEGADDGADHIPEKAVGADGEDEVVAFLGGVAHHSDVVWGICLPTGPRDGAD